MSKWITCKNCSHEYHSSLPRCPKCSKNTPSLKNIATIISIAALCVVVVVGLILGITDKGTVDTVSSNSKPTSASESKPDSNNSANKESNDNSSFDKPVSSASSQGSSQNNSVSKPQSTEKIPTIGTKLIGNYYYSTLPKYYLDYSYRVYKAFYPNVSFEDYAYKLHDEQKSIGTEEIIKNADGSATHKIHKNKINDHSTNLLIGLVELKSELSKQDYISEIKHNKTMDTLTISLTLDELDEIQKYNIVMLGLRNFENQLFMVSKNKTNVVINYKSGNQETLNFPDDIK